MIIIKKILKKILAYLIIALSEAGGKRLWEKILGWARKQTQ
jgi:hypothetical protein